MNTAALEDIISSEARSLRRYGGFTACVGVDDLRNQGRHAALKALAEKPRHPKTFVRRRVRWRMLDELRRHRRRGVHEVTIDRENEDTVFVAGDMPSPEELTIVLGALEDVLRAMRHIGSLYRWTILQLLMGAEAGDIAAARGISSAGACHLIKRARAALRYELGEEFDPS